MTGEIASLSAGARIVVLVDAPPPPSRPKRPIPVPSKSRP